MTRFVVAKSPRGRPREFDVDAVVGRAMEVFWTKGYDGTSLPDLLEATGLARGSLYAAFGDKRSLFLRALDRYISDSLGRLDEELAPDKGALQGLRTCLDGYVDRTCGAKGRRGCLVVATAMELAAKDTEVERRIKRFFKALEERMAAAFGRARTEGGLADGVDPASAARVLVCMVEGLRVVAKTGLERTTWRKAAHSLLDVYAR